VGHEATPEEKVVELWFQFDQVSLQLATKHGAFFSPTASSFSFPSGQNQHPHCKD